MSSTQREATCPSCAHSGEFIYLGDQHWPQELARALNIPHIVQLWSCPCCQTTISELELLPWRLGISCPQEKPTGPIATLFR